MGKSGCSIPPKCLVKGKFCGGEPFSKGQEIGGGDGWKAVHFREFFG